MFRLDMIGPAGVGKSTLHRHLRNEEGRRWLDKAEAARQLAPFGLEPNRGLGLRPTAIVRWRRLLIGRRGMGTRERMQTWSSYLAWCDEMIDRLDYGGSFVILTRRLALHAAAVELYGTTAPVLYHESISRRGISFALRRDDRSRFIENYFRWIPPPRCLIYLQASPETIAERLQSRSLLAAPQRGLGAEDLIDQAAWSCEAVSRAATILRRRGSDVIEIDAEGEVTESAMGLRHALSEYLADQGRHSASVV